MAVCAPTIACTLLVDTSDLSGSALLPSDAGESEGSSDASSTDAPNAEAGPRVPFCSTIDSGFCDDFDGPGLAVQWDGVDGKGGSITIDTAAFVSPSSSLLVDGPKFDAATEQREIVLRKQISTGAGHIACSFKIRLDDIGPDPERLFEIELDAPDKTSVFYGFYPGISSSVSFADHSDQNGANLGHRQIDVGGALTTFPIGTWRTVGINIDFNRDNAGVLRFSLDGVERPPQDFLQFANTATVTVFLGIEADTTGHGIRYRVDDFTCSTD